jgi:hypothetical protein
MLKLGMKNQLRYEEIIDCDHRDIFCLLASVNEFVDS